MRLWFLIIIINLGISFAACSGEVSELSISSLAQINRLTQAIESKAVDPQNIFVLGIGRSPGPFIAFEKAKNPRQASNLPLSDFRYGIGKPPYGDLSPHQVQILFKHFDHFLPGISELNGKELLIIDYSFSGESVVAASRYLDRYFKARNRIQKVTAVAIVDPDFINEVTQETSKLNGHPVEYVVLEHRANDFDPRKGPQDSELAYLLANQQFDETAEYSSYKLPEDEYVAPKPIGGEWNRLTNRITQYLGGLHSNCNKVLMQTVP